MSAAEAVYWLRSAKRVIGKTDEAGKLQRTELLNLLRTGDWMPAPQDTYPIQDGGGTPVAVVRTDSVDDPNCREAFKGFV